MSKYDVLIVDDEQESRHLISSILTNQGLTVRCAPGGAEALEIVRDEKPAVMVLDLLMPKMSGAEVCKTIKADPRLRDIIVMILSGSPKVEDKLNCFRLGAEEYLVKPIDNRELAARVNRFLRMALETAPGGNGAGKQEPGSSVPPPPPGPSKYGAYRVEQLVASGGMGQLFRARDEILERDVAIKVLSPLLTSTAEFVERFHREAKALAAISHPSIAAVYSFGEQEGRHYFAMQWCAGGSVADLLRKDGSLEMDIAVDIMLQCAEGLNAAARKGIVHRDIKPGNLMFDEDQRIKIVDFGLAYGGVVDSHLTRVGEVLGTPNYMAPEQAKSPNVDHRADIYSLGITFYAMLYGRLPFKAATPIEMLMKHSVESFPDQDPADRKVPDSAYKIIRKMCEKRRDDRHQDYASLIEELLQLKEQLRRGKELAAPALVDLEEIKSQIPEGVVLVREPAFELILNRLSLSPQQSFVASRLDSPGLSVPMLITVTGLPEDVVLRAVWLLYKAGAIQLSIPVASVRLPRAAAAVDADTNRTPLVKESLTAGPLDTMVRMEILKSEKRVEVETQQKVAERLYRLAEKKYEEGDYYTVTNYCRQAIGMFPDEAKYYLLAARAFAQHPRFVKDAQIYYEKACEHDPWNTDTRVELAEFYASQGLRLRAIAECKKALMTAPEHPGATALHQKLKRKR